MVIDRETVEAMVLGGALLGGGGGGSVEMGRRLGRLALRMGEPRLIGVDEVGDHALAATVSLVGAPAAPEAHVTPEDHIGAVLLLGERVGSPLSGLVSSENGGSATVNGLLQSAALGIPVLDAPCDGRAHPTGAMGALGLRSLEGYISRQAALGGDPERGRNVRLLVESTLPRADALIRQAAVEAGGLVAVACNPVTIAHLRAHGAPGAIAMAVRLGEVMWDERTAERDGPSVAERLAGELGGRVLVEGEVRGLVRETRGGHDLGRLTVGDVELTFWNEYMTAERTAGERLATFPDLIASLDADHATPLTTAELREGARVLVLAAPRERLLLGAGLREPENFRAVEAAIGKPVIRYLFPEAEEGGV
jgi:DUF917 family protein